MYPLQSLKLLIRTEIRILKNMKRIWRETKENMKFIKD